MRQALGNRGFIATGSVMTAVALVGCGSKTSNAVTTTGTVTTNYPSVVRQQFQQSCVAEAHAASNAASATVTGYCKCALAYVEAHLPYTEFERADEAVAQMKAAPAAARSAFAAAAKTCKAKFALG